ncbi:MAG: DUF5412 domain-containing protein [Actinomycetia bacterium]|nr:DUF5412 domain-containing protein [Actinomycetes bacterium]
MIAATLVVLAVVAYGVIALRTGTLLQTVTSPDGAWQIDVYIVDGGAMDGGALRVVARPRDGRAREVAMLTEFQELLFSEDGFDDEWPGQLEIRWLGGDRASVGGHELDLGSGQRFEDY